MILFLIVYLQELYASISAELELVEEELNKLGVATGGYLHAFIAYMHTRILAVFTE